MQFKEHAKLLYVCLFNGFVLLALKTILNRSLIGSIFVALRIDCDALHFFLFMILCVCVNMNDVRVFFTFSNCRGFIVVPRRGCWWTTFFFIWMSVLFRFFFYLISANGKWRKASGANDFFFVRLIDFSLYCCSSWSFDANVWLLQYKCVYLFFFFLIRVVCWFLLNKTFT